jgi:hypothetical protein
MRLPVAAAAHKRLNFSAASSGPAPSVSITPFMSGHAWNGPRGYGSSCFPDPDDTNHTGRRVI